MTYDSCTITIRCITSAEAREALLHSQFVDVLGSMVLMATDEDSCPGQPSPPGVPLGVVQAAAARLMPSAEDLQTQVRYKHLPAMYYNQ